MALWLWILDARGIAHAANILGEARNATKVGSDAAVGAKNADTQTLVLVRLASGGHAAIPLEMVERLEEFPTKTLERIGAQQAIQYRAMAWPLLGLDALFTGTAQAVRVCEAPRPKFQRNRFPWWFAASRGRKLV